jgi:hypothetical protein
MDLKATNIQNLSWVWLESKEFNYQDTQETLCW